MPLLRHSCLATLGLALSQSLLSRADGVNTAQFPLQEDGKQPNIVFILTDDQDLHLDSLSYMPQLKKHITDQGTSFSRHYCTVALCCPSRVSLWTGKAAHNTNVTDVNPPYGKAARSSKFQPASKNSALVCSSNLLKVCRWLPKVRVTGLQFCISAALAART